MLGRVRRIIAVVEWTDSNVHRQRWQQRLQSPAVDFRGYHIRPTPSHRDLDRRVSEERLMEQIRLLFRKLWLYASRQ